jgi:hypothetical protein
VAVRQHPPVPLRRRYRVGQKKFDELLAEQGGVCAICGTPGHEHVDHDHLFGNVRGIVCFTATTVWVSSRTTSRT